MSVGWGRSTWGTGPWGQPAVINVTVSVTGNAGTSDFAKNVIIDINNFQQVYGFIKQKRITRLEF